jgi:hypothetical protein
MHRLPLLTLSCLLAGCASNPSNFKEAPPAAYDAAAIAQAAMRDYDKDKNGSLEGSELDACPALKAALSALDRNHDGKISVEELKQRIEEFAQRGNVPVVCTVRLDGQPLEGATVTFEPEPFMGDSAKRVAGTTDRNGMCRAYQADGATYTQLAPGFYRVRITKEGSGLPGRYNTQTTLGIEVYAEPRREEVRIDLALQGR